MNVEAPVYGEPYSRVAASMAILVAQEIVQAFARRGRPAHLHCPGGAETGWRDVLVQGISVRVDYSGYWLGARDDLNFTVIFDLRFLIGNPWPQGKQPIG
jgi:hypothetical protein